LWFGLGTQGRLNHALAFCSYITYITRMTQDMVRPTDDPKGTTLQMRVSAGYLKSIDEWRRQQPDLPSRSEAIRRLTAIALGNQKPSNLKPKQRQPVPSVADWFSKEALAEIKAWAKKHGRPSLSKAVRDLTTLGIEAGGEIKGAMPADIRRLVELGLKAKAPK
jgi:hypothetical protein